MENKYPTETGCRTPRWASTVTSFSPFTLFSHHHYPSMPSSTSAHPSAPHNHTLLSVSMILLLLFFLWALQASASQCINKMGSTLAGWRACNTNLTLIIIVVAIGCPEAWKHDLLSNSSFQTRGSPGCWQMQSPRPSSPVSGSVSGVRLRNQHLK